MPMFWSEDMCDALVEAYDRFLNNNNGSFFIESEKCATEITHVNRGGRHDYGPHYSFYCTNSGAGVVASRWKDMTDNRGLILPIQRKPPPISDTQINLILLSSEGATLFNFHVTLMTEREEEELKFKLDQKLLMYQASRNI